MKNSKATEIRSCEIYLPTTEEEFDQLVSKVVQKYKLPNGEHAAVVIANAIMHLPREQATTTLKYLGHCVLKNIAYQIAQAKGSKIAHRHQIDDLEAILRANMLDQQARDALEKAVNEGSEYAKKAYDRLYPPEESAPYAPNPEFVQ